MDILKNRRTEHKRIGELLVEAGIVKPEKIPEALKVVRQTGLPTGRVLIMLGGLTERDLENALQAQAMMREGALPGATAVTAIRIAAQRRCSLAEALKGLGWEPPEEVTLTSELGDLLVAAGYLTRAQVDDALRKTARTRTPIGRFLVLQGMLSPSLLAAALSAQVLIRNGKITRDQAIQGLKLALTTRSSLEQALSQQGVYHVSAQDKIKLGELLSSAALVAESDTLMAVELGLSQDQPMGQILVEAGVLPQPSLEAAVKLQDMVRTGLLTAAQAAAVLKQVHARGLPLKQVIGEMRLLQEDEGVLQEVLELLKISGLVTDHAIRIARDAASRSGTGVRTALIQLNLLDKNLFDAALKCYELKLNGLLKLEQAIIALNYCARSRITLQDAFEELVWDIPLAPAIG